MEQPQRLKLVEVFNGGYTSTYVDVFILELQKALNDVPPEYREFVDLSFESAEQYEMPYVQITASYERPMTPEEALQEEQKEKARNDFIEKQERLKYLELKRKYGEGDTPLDKVDN